MRPDVIFWDFNGTLLDDIDACFISINELLVNNSLPPLPDIKKYKEIFGFPIIDYYARAGFDFNIKSFETLAPEWVRLYEKYSRPYKLCPGAKNALELVKSAGIPQIILTASKTQMVKSQCEELGISDMFDGIIGQDNIHAYGKTEAAIRYIKAHPVKSAVLIGDTDHDALTADGVGIDCVLVSCGHQNKDKLCKIKPCFSDPYSAVLSILE